MTTPASQRARELALLTIAKWYSEQDSSRFVLGKAGLESLEIALTAALLAREREAQQEAYERTAKLADDIHKLGMPDDVVSIAHWCRAQAKREGPIEAPK
jgi:hypothetical protein